MVGLLHVHMMVLVPKVNLWYIAETCEELQLRIWEFEGISRLSKGDQSTDSPFLPKGVDWTSRLPLGILECARVVG